MSIDIREAPPEIQAAETVFQKGRTRLPVMTAPADAADILDHRWLAAIGAHLARDGGVLLRGFADMNIERFHDFAKRFGSPLLSYEFGSTPRSEVKKGVYSSTDYPAHQWIPQHNEQAYTTNWPMKIWFYCDVEPADRGQTPVADARAVYQGIDPALRERFATRAEQRIQRIGGIGGSLVEHSRALLIVAATPGMQQQGHGMARGNKIEEYLHLHALQRLDAGVPRHDVGQVRNVGQSVGQ